MEKTLELKMPGIIELGRKELKSVEGGFGPLFWLAVGVLVSEVLDRNAPNDFEEGYNDFKIDYQKQ